MATPSIDTIVLMDFELLTFPRREMIKLSIHTGLYYMFPKSIWLAEYNEICRGSLLSSILKTYRVKFLKTL